MTAPARSGTLPRMNSSDLVLAMLRDMDNGDDDAFRARFAPDCEWVNPVIRANGPDEIVAVPAIPRTMTGKKLELPVKRIIGGAPVAEVASRDALADPAAIEAFVAYAEERAGRG